MKKRLWASTVLACLAWGPSVGAEPSLCARLAEEVRRAPAATWAQAEPLATWVQPAGAAASSPTVDTLAAAPSWRDALGALHAPEVQQLEGSHLYLLSDVQGTARCQSVVFVESRPGQAGRAVRPPFRLGAPNLCTTQSASFARVLGQPAFVAGGAVSMTRPELRYRVATWTGQGWSGRCQVTLRLATALQAVQRFCPAGGKVCEAGQAVAQQLAQAYEASRATQRPLDALALNGGRRPEGAVAAALNPPLDEPGAVGDMNPPFPLFGADETHLDPMATRFSNADPRRVAVYAGGQWWLAVVGRAGVGWREGEAVLVALFAPPGRTADGVASYQFRVQPTGLAQATAMDLRP